MIHSISDMEGYLSWFIGGLDESMMAGGLWHEHIAHTHDEHVISSEGFFCLVLVV